MPDERRYAEDEVAAILEAAARSPERRHGVAQTEGALTLGELQSIGAQVGLEPARIADAAAALELRREARPRGTELGMPVSVGRTLELPRAPTEREWQLLLTELRQTFGVRGHDRSMGDLRAWTIGNLFAYVEPTETGHQLRMGTLKQNGVMVGRMGVVGVVLGVLLLLIGQLAGDFASPVGGPLVLVAFGLAALAFNALRLPRWADEREAQMEHVATRARTLISADPPPPAPAAE